MTVRLRTRLWVLVFAVVAATPFAFARHTAPASHSPQTAALTEVIGPDPLITTGKLPNGMTYYIRANKKPENRAELRLAVGLSREGGVDRGPYLVEIRLGQAEPAR